MDVLPGAFALRLTDGYAAAAPTLTRALDLLLTLEVTAEKVGPSRWLTWRRGQIVALELWDAFAGSPRARRPGPFADAVAFAVFAHPFWLPGRHTAVRIRPDGMIINNVLVRHVIPCQMLLFIAKRRF